MTVIEEVLSEDEEPVIEEGEEDEEGERLKKEIDPAVFAEHKAQFARKAEEEAKRVQKQFAEAEESKTEGSMKFAAGKMEGAIECYEEAVRSLFRVGNKPENRKRAEEMNLALHLNISLAFLKLEAFEAAKDHASSAWAIDQQNVKALYRRAMAQAGLARHSAAFQDAEAKGACEDFQALLKIEPNNADARRELQKLKSEMQSHKEASVANQKEFYGNIFGGKAEGEDLVFDDTELMVRPIDYNPEERHCIIKAQSVAVGKGPVLAHVDIDLIERWCVGICAKDGPEKTAFVDVFMRRVKPSAGKFKFPKKKKRGVNPDEVWIVTTPIMLAVVAGAAAIVWGICISTLDWYLTFLFGMLLVLTVPLVLYLWYEQQLEKRPPIVIHVTPNGCRDWKPAANMSVKDLLAAALPKKVKDRQDRAFALLRAAGMPEKEDKCLFKDLSEDQKQTVYILRCIVLKSKVIIVDDAFRDLELASQSRMLRMMKRLKQDCNASIVFISPDMQQLTLVCDSLGLLSDGKLCEFGPTDEVLVRPRHDAMKEVIAESKKMAQEVGVKEVYNQLLKDSALSTRSWLPKDNKL